MAVALTAAYSPRRNDCFRLWHLSRGSSCHRDVWPGRLIDGARPGADISTWGE